MKCQLDAYTITHYAILVGLALAPLAGCTANKASNTTQANTRAASPARRTFLDETRQVPPRKEWTREITSRGGGTFMFRVESQGPFEVTVVTDKGFRALTGADQSTFSKQDVLLKAVSKEPTLEKSATVPPGSSWFIIENQSDKPVQLHLQCFSS
jgi:hypothetical protein